MQVRDAVRRRPVMVDATTTLAAAAGLMDRAGVGTVLVTDGGRLVGIVTDRDVVVRGVARRLPLDARIDAVMSAPLETVQAGPTSSRRSRPSPSTPSAGCPSSTGTSWWGCSPPTTWWSTWSTISIGSSGR